MMKTFKDTDLICMYASCKLTKGAKFATISDLERYNTYSIPMDLYELLHVSNGFRPNDFYQDGVYPELITEYLDFLLDNHICFVIDEKMRALFPPLDDTYINPFEITNVIIDVKSNTKFIKSFLDDTSLEIIPNLQIRFLDSKIDYIEFVTLLDIIMTKEIEYLQVVISSKVFKSIHEYDALNKYKNKLDVLFVYDSACSLEIDNLLFGIVFIKKDIDSVKHCGIISYENFSTNIETYTESIHFNSCLNRKISIDAEGYIKNCPSMNEHYGHILSTTLRDALNTHDFKKYWNITKSQIEGCRDCEYRNVCTDCRAYRETPNDIFSKPLKCGYNPHSGIWEDWSTNPLKAEAINYYKMQEFVKNI